MIVAIVTKGGSADPPFFVCVPRPVTREVDPRARGGDGSGVPHSFLRDCQNFSQGVDSSLAVDVLAVH